MPARILLLLALVAGLAFVSGSMPGYRPVQQPCTCCPMPATSTCCSSDEAPAQDSPLPAPTPSAAKQFLAPALPLLAILPPATEQMPAHRRASALTFSAPARLALLCTRLI
jgi:hypothetical protein